MKIAMLPAGLLAAVLMGPAHAAAPSNMTEGFDDITTLAGSGWVQTNNSAPPGTTGWFQGNAGVFTSQAGADDSYIAANFNNAEFGGAIDNWLISPELSLGGGAVLTFYTRTEDPAFGDTLEVKFSSGAGFAVAGFTTNLLTVDPYPGSDWASFSVALPSVASGRFAFRYVVADTSVAGDYIGIDTVNVTAAVPEPQTYALMALGVAALALRRRSAAS